MIEQINSQTNPKHQQQQQGIDPIKSARDGDIFPLIAAFPHLDFDTLVDTFTPLSHYICTLYIPLQTLLNQRQLPMIKNIQDRLPLSFAIKAKDPLATYYCLQQPHQLNTRSIYGLTPAMEALKSEFRIGFLLCVHFGHITNDLANIAAENNDVWALKLLKVLNIPLNQKDFKGITPLESAIANYSYESIDYIGKLYPKDIKMDKIGKIVKSKTIFNNLKQIKSNTSPPSSLFKQSFLKQVSYLVVLFFLVNSLPRFSQLLFLNITFLLQLYFVLLYHNPSPSPKKRTHNILKMIQPFLRTQLPQICPTCIQIRTSNFDHCDKCGVCIQGFHFHQSVCTSKRNQGRWAIKQTIWLVILSTIVSDIINSLQNSFTSSWRHMEAFSILYSQSSFLLADFLLYSTCFYFYIKQILYCFLIFYIITSGRTYQQVRNSQKYLNLYQPVLLAGKYYNRPINSQDYTLKKGLRLAVANTIKFFCG